jgi:hypothetical protein
MKMNPLQPVDMSLSSRKTAVSAMIRLLEISQVIMVPGAQQLKCLGTKHHGGQMHLVVALRCAALWSQLT